jgi:mRNA-degrading endonuclease YafQ of YafQ-DinJ toxin-antitoxin module
MWTIKISKQYSRKAKKFFKQHPSLLHKYEKTLWMMERDPFHPSLRLHHLKGKLQDFHSISINMQYRIIIDFIIREEEIILIDIGAHEEVY